MLRCVRRSGGRLVEVAVVCLPLLLAVACGGAREGRGDGGAHSTDAGYPHRDAPIASDDSGLTPLPDAAAVLPVLCQTAASDVECNVQVPESVGACGGTGAVVFDGTTCVLAAGAECSGERGAFDSFEQCARSCASAGHCDRTRFRNLGLSCDRLWTCTAGEPAEDQLCGLSEAWSCNEPVPDPPNCVEGRRCWKISVDVTPELEEQLCALSLMPTVAQVRCFNYL